MTNLSTEPRVATHRLPKPSLAGSSDPLKTSQTLLADLEASLRTGQKALLDRNADALNAATAEQLRLCASLQPVLKNVPANQTARIVFRPAVERVLHEARVQSALLQRAQGFLLTLSRLSSAPQATYEALITRHRVNRNFARPEAARWGA
jgi:hypothetical protein